MAKISKPAAGYLPASLIGTTGGIGTRCGRCRDFIKGSSECLILTEPKVSAEHGTCTQYLTGEPYTNAKPLKLISKELVGYIESGDVPTYCGRCEYYTEKGRYKGECSKVDGTIEFAACCNMYEADDAKAD